MQSYDVNGIRNGIGPCPASLGNALERSDAARDASRRPMRRRSRSASRRKEVNDYDKQERCGSPKLLNQRRRVGPRRGTRRAHAVLAFWSDIVAGALVSFGVDRRKIQILPLGGQEAGRLDKGYEQRVEVRIFNTLP